MPLPKSRTRPSGASPRLIETARYDGRTWHTGRILGFSSQGMPSRGWQREVPCAIIVARQTVRKLAVACARRKCSHADVARLIPQIALPCMGIFIELGTPFFLRFGAFLPCRLSPAWSRYGGVVSFESVTWLRTFGRLSCRRLFDFPLGYCDMPLWLFLLFFCRRVWRRYRRVGLCRRRRLRKRREKWW